jgi:hypothetical protein
LSFIDNAMACGLSRAEAVAWHGRLRREARHIARGIRSGRIDVAAVLGRAS